MTHSFNHIEIKRRGRFELSVKENVRIKKDKIKRHFLSSNYVFPAVHFYGISCRSNFFVSACNVRVVTSSIPLEKPATTWHKFAVYSRLGHW